MLLMVCSLIAVVDGDTVKCDGESIRLIGNGAPFKSGFDTPETYRPQCQQELELGRAATARMRELVRDAVGIEDTGKHDRYGRVLGRLVLKNGKTAGEVLIEEGYAKPWKPNSNIDWCR
ncbi:thermonuclease family protein [Celeribacter halophilus]|uniref:Thermonuclease family protein n=1 Tax=Celeribacter halophilus TaxID=576117 RepID=A0AAW7Y1U5_9RHOB|nr:thermonuclease family protein [Celeribacter halophilus]MDO6458994.1 thermonuclease family protein [Celeribacter halophilus]